MRVVFRYCDQFCSFQEKVRTSPLKYAHGFQGKGSDDETIADLKTLSHPIASANKIRTHISYFI